MLAKRQSVFFGLLLGLNIFAFQEIALGHERMLENEQYVPAERCTDTTLISGPSLYLNERQVILAQFEDSQDKKQIGFLLDQAEARLTVSGKDEEYIHDVYLMLRQLSCVKLKIQRQEKEIRSLLLRQVVEQLADPLQVNQGSRRTCALTVLEQKSYFSEPAVAIKMILHTVQGKSAVDKLSLLPDEEALVAPSVYGKRSFASQLFQIGLANMYWSKRSRDPFGRSVVLGSIVYVQHLEEGLMIRDQNGAMRELLDPCGQPVHHPALRLCDLNELWSQLIDSRGQKVTLGNDTYAFNKNGESFGSPDDLVELLSQVQSQHRLPMIVAVTSQSQSNKRSKNWHAALVLSFDAQTGTAVVSDWYVNGQRCQRAIRLSVNNLFRASAPVAPVIALAQ